MLMTNQPRKNRQGHGGNEMRLETMTLVGGAAVAALDSKRAPSN
jgi:hypothetical protein